jgi:hypothetical protein
MTDTRDPAADCLRRTRLAVAGALLAAALVAASGSALVAAAGRPLTLPGFVTPRLLLSLVAGLLAISLAVLRLLGGREALRDPSTRATRFFGSRVLTAALGAPAAMLGVVHAAAFGVDPAEQSPFWVAAVAPALLAFPRGYELRDFDEPMGPPE